MSGSNQKGGAHWEGIPYLLSMPCIIIIISQGRDFAPDFRKSLRHDGCQSLYTPESFIRHIRPALAERGSCMRYAVVITESLMDRSCDFKVTSRGIVSRVYLLSAATSLQHRKTEAIVFRSISSIYGLFTTRQISAGSVGTTPLQSHLS